MKKIDKIDGCYHCPLMLHRWSDVWYCTHNGDTRPIDYTKIKEIPIWCPLPDDTSQSAKPERSSHSRTPCLADTHTPDSKHSGANDGEVNEDNRAVKKLCGCYRLTIGKVPIPNCKYCHGTGWIDLILECDPEGMKPKSKYEKAFRDVNE